MYSLLALFCEVKLNSQYQFLSLDGFTERVALLSFFHQEEIMYKTLFHCDNLTGTIHRETEQGLLLDFGGRTENRLAKIISKKSVTSGTYTFRQQGCFQMTF